MEGLELLHKGGHDLFAGQDGGSQVEGTLLWMSNGVHARRMMCQK